jgi:hypothetical protein
MRLTKKQIEALWQSEPYPMSSDFWKARGISIATTESLVRRGLLSEWNYANGPHWELTEAGREALREQS